MTVSSVPTESRHVFNQRSGLIEILSGGADRYVVKAEQGNFTLNIPGTTTGVYMDRGRLYDPSDPEDEPSVLDDQDQPLTGSFSAYLRDMNSNDYLTLYDFIALYGMAAQIPSTLECAGNDAPKLVIIQWWFNGQRHGDLKNKGIRCRHCKITGSIAEGSPNMITCNFTSFMPLPEPAKWER